MRNKDVFNPIHTLSCTISKPILTRTIARTFIYYYCFNTRERHTFFGFRWRLAANSRTPMQLQPAPLSNSILAVNRHPLPDIDDLLSQLAGEVAFSKLERSRAYHQLRLDEQSQELTTSNTRKELFCYHQLRFGITSAPAIF